MAKKKRQAFQQKLRTREHVIAELAVNHVERQALLCGFSVERIVHDYGIDLILFTYNDLGELEDESILLQVKGRERVTTLEAGQELSFRVARADVQTWLRHRMPVILVTYDVSTDLAYWLYVQRHFAHQADFDVATAAATTSLRLPRSQALTPDAIRQFAGFRDSILGNSGGSTMPECTFATLRDVLLELGFSMRTAADAVVFEDTSASARLIMEPFGEQEAVDTATLIVVRRNLDERGILPRARFDDLLRQRSLAG